MLGGKSSERMLNHSNCERVRHFYVIFSVLMYFLSLKKIAVRDRAKWIAELVFLAGEAICKQPRPLN